MSIRPVLFAGGALAASLALVVTLAPAASAASAKTAEMFLSVGTDGDGKACNLEEESSCELVQVKLDLSGATPKATLVKTLVTADAAAGKDTNPVEPAVSPDGTRLAWLERNSKTNQIWVRTLADGKNYLVAKSGSADEGGVGVKPEWPAFLGDDTLLYSGKSGEENGVQLKTVYSMDIKSPGTPGKPSKRFGAALGDAGGLQDPNVHWTGSGGEVVTFGPADTSGNEVYSLNVRTIDAAGRVSGTPATIARGKNLAGKELSACHHPAWNASGNAILCQAHSPAESIDGMSTKALYKYTRDAAGKWASAGRAFETLSAEKAKLEVASKLSASAGCSSIVYKFAEYCRSDDYILTSMYCAEAAAEGGRGSSVGASRLVLVKTDTAQYIDVTRLVEQDRGLAAGALSGFSGTCSSLK